jgi:ABC-type multidrug transport system fused ATPase/permease subunit
LLILDEATSALDSESEESITTALRQISRETTILVVAHRLSTVRHCDRILVLDVGRIVGFDTHANLLRDCALYRRFVELGDLALEDAEPMLAPHAR